MTVPKLYHHTFSPWTVADGTRVIASERAWSKLLKLDKDAAKTGERVRVNIGVDVFEDVDERIVDREDRAIYLVDGKFRTLKPGQFFLTPRDRATTDDVCNMVFSLIDQTPNLDWLIETKWPENIERMMPPTPVYVSKSTGELLPYWGPNKTPRPNLWLGTSVTTQAEADQRIPHLLKCPAAVRYVMLTPREEIDLRPKAPDTYGQLGTCYRGVDPVALTASPDRVLNCFPRIGWAIVSGDTEPLHPDCVRSLRDQCQAAGVPFWFEGWGEWAPGNFGPGGDLYDRDRTKIESGMFDYSGHWNSGGPNPFRQTMDRVGKKAAGRTLDGREWNELPEVGK